MAKVASIDGRPIANGMQYVSRITRKGYRAFIIVIESLFVMGEVGKFTSLSDAATAFYDHVAKLTGDNENADRKKAQGGKTTFAPLDIPENKVVREAGFGKPVCDGTAGATWDVGPEGGIKGGYPVAEAKTPKEPKALPNDKAGCKSLIGKLEAGVKRFEDKISKVRAHMETLPKEEAAVEAAATPAKGKGKGKGK